MKKRIKLIIGIVLISNLLCACSSNKKIESYEPGLAQIKHICELSTLECYYHNVAKSKKKVDLRKRIESFGLNTRELQELELICLRLKWKSQEMK